MRPGRLKKISARWANNPRKITAHRNKAKGTTAFWRAARRSLW